MDEDSNPRFDLKVAHNFNRNWQGCAPALASCSHQGHGMKPSRPLLPDWVSAPPELTEDQRGPLPPADPTFLTHDAPAKLLQVSTRTVRRLIASGRIGALRIGRAVRIPHAEIDRLVLGENPAIHGTSEECRDYAGRPMGFK